MGFEIHYDFHEKVDGKYNKEETKSKKKKIGDPFDDVSFETLASEIIKLQARRDIFVTEVKIFELSRKEISYRETKGGIVIKNKKFMFDDEGYNLVKEVSEELPSQSMPVFQQTNAPVVQHQNAPPLPPLPPLPPNAQPHNANRPKRVLKHMVFSPPLIMINEIKAKALRFTVDKRYPIFKTQIKPNGIGENYTTTDDIGREVVVPDEYFVNDLVLSGGDDDPVAQAPVREVRLDYGNIVEDHVPVLRR